MDREQHRCAKGSEGLKQQRLLEQEKQLRESGGSTELEICVAAPKLCGIGAGIFMTDTEIEEKLWSTKADPVLKERSYTVDVAVDGGSGPRRSKYQEAHKVLPPGGID